MSCGFNHPLYLSFVPKSAQLFVLEMCWPYSLHFLFFFACFFSLYLLLFAFLPLPQPSRKKGGGATGSPTVAWCVPGRSDFTTTSFQMCQNVLLIFEYFQFWGWFCENMYFFISSVEKQFLGHLLGGLTPTVFSYPLHPIYLPSSADQPTRFCKSGGL